MNVNRLKNDINFKDGYVDCINDILETIKISGETEWIDINKQFPSTEFDWVLVCDEIGNKPKFAHFKLYDEELGARWYTDDGTFVPLDSWMNINYWKPVDIQNSEDVTILSALVAIKNKLLKESI